MDVAEVKIHLVLVSFCTLSSKSWKLLQIESIQAPDFVTANIIASNSKKK
jgi:hypothetical protein